MRLASAAGSKLRRKDRRARPWVATLRVWPEPTLNTQPQLFLSKQVHRSLFGGTGAERLAKATMHCLRVSAWNQTDSNVAQS